MNDFFKMNQDELVSYIVEQKKKYGSSLIMPAHHYQRMEIVDLADFIGDSYKLAVDCTKTDAEFILFCGVRFMAEGASVLGKEGQKVIIPEPLAGCPMADMIDEERAVKAFEKMSAVSGRQVVPIVYMNSYADMKSFCGEREGTVCTSSNAASIIDYYLKQDKAIFFFPDFNLGINTAKVLGIKENEMVKVTKSLELNPLGGQEDLKDTRLFLWDGFCHVHKEFTTGNINRVRRENPGITLIVHPESDEKVVDNSEYNGSTQKIYNTIKDAPEGSAWAVGTELHFVNRIAREFPGKKVIPLKESPCFNMEKITLAHVARSLFSIENHLNGSGELVYEIEVNPKYKKFAKAALEKMIEIVEG